MPLCKNKQDSIRNCVTAVATLITRWYREGKIDDQDRVLAKLYLTDILECTMLYARPIKKQNKAWKNSIKQQIPNGRKGSSSSSEDA